LSFFQTSQQIIGSRKPLNTGDEPDDEERDDDIEEVRDRLIEEDPAVVTRGASPATAVLFRNMVSTMKLP
jgi:hypothetical protein